MISEKAKRIIIISGPTASGKSALGVRLACDIGGEIISADSMQVYKHMDIGTAKVTAEEMQGIPHHMIDVCEPTVNYSIADYKAAARDKLEDIVSRGRIPVIVGGTCFYIHALLYDSEFDIKGPDDSIRRRLLRELDESGAYALHRRLEEIDPQSAAAIHMNNTKRVIRAIEFFEQNGYTISEHNRREKEKEPPYRYCYFALRKDREELNRLIDLRVDRMIENGLVQEVEYLKSIGCDESCISMQGIGYKELYNCTDLEQAVYDIKNNSHHYEKKQYTWLNREKNVTWIDSPVSEEDYRCILKKCTELLG